MTHRVFGSNAYMIYKRERTSPEFCQISTLDFLPSSVSSVSRGAAALIADCIVIGLQPWFKGVITAGNRAQFPPSEHSWTPEEDWTDGKLPGSTVGSWRQWPYLLLSSLHSTEFSFCIFIQWGLLLWPIEKITTTIRVHELNIIIPL